MSSAHEAAHELREELADCRKRNAELLAAMKKAHERMKRYGICVDAVEAAIAKAERR